MGTRTGTGPAKVLAARIVAIIVAAKVLAIVAPVMGAILFIGVRSMITTVPYRIVRIVGCHVSATKDGESSPAGGHQNFWKMGSE